MYGPIENAHTLLYSMYDTQEWTKRVHISKLSIF